MNRSALITGGTSGIGLEAAKMLAEEGCDLILLDINIENLAKAKECFSSEQNVRCLVVDLRNAPAVLNAANDLTADNCNVDILVNNVGGSTVRDQAIEMTDTTFDEIVALNLKTMFNSTKAFAPGMMARGWGRIVNVASVAGRTHALSTNSNAAYVAAKAGVIGFTKQCAAEMAGYGVTVNAIAFGPISTPRVEAGWDSRSHESRRMFENSIPAKRFGTTTEAAAGIRYLCSKDAGYTVGAVLDINGGLYM